MNQKAAGILIGILAATLSMAAFAESNCPLEKPNLLELVVGDWSGDGHNKTEKFMICSSLTRPELSKGYADATKKLGFDFSEEIGDAYEDHAFPKDKIELLRNAGVVFTLEDEEYGEEDYVTIYPDDFAGVWLAIVKFGNNSFDHSLLKTEQSIHIGGYGLFE